MVFDVITAILLGIVEGVTEFIPVSATGHRLLLDHIFGFDEAFGATFVALIQLGAILALVSVYFGRLWQLARALPTDPDARRFALGVLVAFVPAGVVGAATHSFIVEMLFNVWVVCSAWVIGGAVLLWVDRLALIPRYTEATKFSLPTYFGIGVAQCLAMIPGVSRSGASIVSAIALGADKRSAAEFSLFLAMPTMVGALAYEFIRDGAQINGENALIGAVGFVTSFVTGWLVVKSFLDYVSHRGLAVFAWWRIVVGALGLIALALFQ